MKKICFSLLLSAGCMFSVYASNSNPIPTPPASFAADSQACQNNGGTLFVATIVSNPVYKSGSSRQGVELSHTHVSAVPIGEQQSSANTYDIAMDNVFASGYDSAEPNNQVPAPLTSLKVGQNVEFCGQPYSDGGGIHWVHTNCGDTPTTSEPNGSVRIINSSGSLGTNLENSTEYCSLWQ